MVGGGEAVVFLGGQNRQDGGCSNVIEAPSFVHACDVDVCVCKSRD